MELMILLAVLVAIAIGLIFHVNIGPFALVFALLFGTLGAGLSVDEIIANIPVSLLYKVVAVTMFYGFAQENGALSGLVGHVLHRSKKAVAWIPTIIFLLSFLVAALGLGVFAGVFMAPVAFELGRKVKRTPLLIFTCVCCGALSGANLPFSLGGVTVHSLVLLNEGSTIAIANSTNLQGSVMTILACVIVTMIVHLLVRRREDGVVEVDNPQPLTKEQRTTLWLIIIVVAVALLPRLLKMFVTKAWVDQMIDILDFSQVCTLGICIAMLLKLADPHKVVERCIPWNTVILMSGFSCLLAVAKELGTMDMITNLMLKTIPPNLIAPALALTAGCLSFFASGVAVVCPMMFPLVPILAASTALSPSILYASIFVGASATGTSPVSTLGNSVVGCSGDVDTQTSLFYKSILIPFLMITITIILSFFNATL